MKDRTMIGKQQASDQDRQRLIARLRELVDALDSRVPHLEREGERRIADDAAALRKKALERIAQLDQAGAP
jgi:IS4 transposase